MRDGLSIPSNYGIGAMMTTNIFVPAAVAAFVILAATGVETVAPKGPTQVSLKNLSFEDGYFHQEFYVTGVGGIDMYWTAEINRGKRQLCSGGDRAPYKDQDPKEYTPDEWTKDDCPELKAGDEAFAVWSYRDDQGVFVRLEKTLVLTEDDLR